MISVMTDLPDKLSTGKIVTTHAILFQSNIPLMSKALSCGNVQYFLEIQVELNPPLTRASMGAS